MGSRLAISPCSSGCTEAPRQHATTGHRLPDTGWSGTRGSVPSRCKAHEGMFQGLARSCARVRAHQGGLGCTCGTQASESDGHDSCVIQTFDLAIRRADGVPITWAVARHTLPVYGYPLRLGREHVRWAVAKSSDRTRSARLRGGHRPSGHSGQVARYGASGRYRVHSARVRLRPAMRQATSSQWFTSTSQTKARPLEPTTTRDPVASRFKKIDPDAAKTTGSPIAASVAAFHN